MPGLCLATAHILCVPGSADLWDGMLGLRAAVPRGWTGRESRQPLLRGRIASEALLTASRCRYGCLRLRCMKPEFLGGLIF